MERSSDTATGALVILAILGVMVALHLMKVILVPVALALMLATVLSPCTNFLRRVLPLSATGASIVLFLLLTVSGLFMTILAADSLQSASRTVPVDLERLAGTISDRLSELQSERPYLREILPDPGIVDVQGFRTSTQVGTMLYDRLADLGDWIAEGLMIGVLVLFLLAESEMLTPKVIRFFAPAPGDARAAERTFRLVIQKIRAYLIARTLLNIGLGVAVTLSLKLLGVGYAVGLGAITAIASFIPYIGQVISGVFVVFASLAQTGSIGDALIVTAVYVALVGVEGYILMPVVMSRSLDLNGTTVLIACLFWGFLWGLVGLVLAIPITVSMKLVFQYVPSLNRWAELMSRDWQTPSRDDANGFGAGEPRPPDEPRTSAAPVPPPARPDDPKPARAPAPASSQT